MKTIATLILAMLGLYLILFQSSENKNIPIEKELSLKDSIAKKTKNISTTLGIPKSRIRTIFSTIILAPLPKVSDKAIEQHRMEGLEFYTNFRNLLFADLTPKEPICIFLSPDAQSQQEAFRKMGVSGKNSWGRYDPSTRTIYSDINIGIGNMTHELAHAMIHADFGFAKDWTGNGRGLALWVDEGIAGIFGSPALFPNDGGDPLDYRHQVLLAWLKATGKFKGNLVSKQEFQTRDFKLSLNWLINLSDAEFYKSYADTKGQPGMCLAREFMLYLFVKGKLPECYRKFKNVGSKGSLNRGQGFRQSLEISMKKKLDQIEKDFIAWTISRPESLAWESFELLAKITKRSNKEAHIKNKGQ